MLPAAPLNVLTGKTAATEPVSPLRRAVLINIRRRIAQGNANTPQVLHAAETEQPIINLAELVIAVTERNATTEHARQQLRHAITQLLRLTAQDNVKTLALFLAPKTE